MYYKSFENKRRVNPRIWDYDYCLLKGLSRAVRNFATEKATSQSILVDYGCGAKPYRDFFPRDCLYYGVDTCDNPNAEISIKPGNKVPLENGLADLILSTQVVYLIPDFNEYLEECKRLLRPGGWMLITTHGTWTYHPASGGDYYRFTQDGIRYVLDAHGFKNMSVSPIVGTLGTGLHLRQLLFNKWLRRLKLSWLTIPLNIFTNLRITLEDYLTPPGSRMSSPVVISVLAQRDWDK